MKPIGKPAWWIGLYGYVLYAAWAAILATWFLSGCAEAVQVSELRDGDHVKIAAGSEIRGTLRFVGKYGETADISRYRIGGPCVLLTKGDWERLTPAPAATQPELVLPDWRDFLPPEPPNADRNHNRTGVIIRGGT